MHFMPIDALSAHFLCHEVRTRAYRVPSRPPMTSRYRLLALDAIGAAILIHSPLAMAAESARPLHDAITVDPGATCLDAATLLEQVQSWIGADTVDADVDVEVRGSPDHPRVVTFRTLRGGRVAAVRIFDPGPARCEQLHAVLGLAIAMALKASLIEEIAQSAAPTSVAAVSIERPATPIDALPPWAAAVQPVLAVGVLPDPAFGLGVRAERRIVHALRARLGVLGVLAPGETFGGAPGRFTTWLLAPRLDLCASLEVISHVQAHGCLGMSGGSLHAQGFDYPRPQSTFIRWLAVANELGVTAELSRHWAVEVDATLILPVARNSIVVRDYSGNVLLQRDLAPAGWFFGAGPLFRF
jgi:hypothetical protein